jgi:hypothetical protein
MGLGWGLLMGKIMLLVKENNIYLAFLGRNFLRMSAHCSKQYNIFFLEKEGTKVIEFCFMNMERSIY